MLRESLVRECNYGVVLQLRVGDRNLAETFDYTTGPNDPIAGPICVPTNGVVRFAPGHTCFFLAGAG